VKIFVILSDLQNRRDKDQFCEGGILVESGQPFAKIGQSGYFTQKRANYLAG